ncbi:hypothetical protein AOQ73_21270 [Bradyrhizobium pachyrhizi]|nr:hypothetical protein AOQ73_21270 [Bradyrhizobium pachyrhizi]
MHGAEKLCPTVPIESAKADPEATRRDAGDHSGGISQFETGRLENPSLGTVLKAFATLGIDLNIDSLPGHPARNDDLDTGDLALDEPSFLKGRRR